MVTTQPALFDAELCNTACDLQQSATTESVFVLGFVVGMRCTTCQKGPAELWSGNSRGMNLTVPIKIKITCIVTQNCGFRSKVY